jgi:hypothetical protein
MTLRRLGFASTLAAGALMLGTAVHGMTGVDERLEIAAAQPDGPHAVYVLDAPRPTPRDCEPPRHHRPRV